MAIAAAMLVGCYDPPQPQCGFRCGPAAECPAGYVCGSDNRCRTEGTPESVACATPDAATFPDTGDADSRPAVVETMPAMGAANVPVDVTLSVRFSKDVAGVSTSTFTLTSGSAVPGEVTYGAAMRTAFFNPIDQLAANTTYTFALTPGITDTASQPLVPFSASFTTGADTITPKVRTVSPPPAATMIAVTANVVIVFDEPVLNATTASVQLEGGTIAGTVTTTNGGRTVTFDPDASLPAATQIDVTLSSAITDAAGNAFVPLTYSFTTM